MHGLADNVIANVLKTSIVIWDTSDRGPFNYVNGNFITVPSSTTGQGVLVSANCQIRNNIIVGRPGMYLFMCASAYVLKRKVYYMGTCTYVYVCRCCMHISKACV